MNSLTESTTALKERLLSDFQTSESQLNGDSTTLHQIRRDAIRQFERLGFPTTKHEEWKYTNVGPITKQTFHFQAPASVSKAELEAMSISHLEANVLVFINGLFQESLSTVISPKEEVWITTFSKAAQQAPELFNQYFAQSAPYDQDAFTALSTAFAHHGAFVHVPDGKVVEKPIVFYFLSDSRQGNVAAQPRNLLIASTNSQVKVVEVFQSLGDQPSFTNTVTELFLAQAAYVEHYKVQNESDQAYHVGTTLVSQHKGSHFYTATLTLDGGFVRNTVNIVLNGEHCETNMYGLYLPDGKQHVDNHTTVDHAKPNCYSNELYKGILNGRSTGVFNGKIFVRQDAQKTNAFQSNKNILLSADASMNTKPQLEIFADDVKCSHGTTTGQLDEDALFYLRARGIGEDNAKALLMVAFAQDVIKQIRIPALQEYLEGLIAKKLSTQ